MNNKMSSMSALLGAAFVASASLAPMASATDATFAATQLEVGYTLADNHDHKSDSEHKCGEGKCAAEHKQSKDDKKAGTADKKTDGENKCGEGKCGEGKCGAGKDKTKDAAEEKKAE